MSAVRIGLKFLGGVVALALLGVLVAVIIAVSYDYDQLKPVVVQAVKDATGRDLKIAGNIDLSVSFDPFPMPVLSVSGVSLSNASWGLDRPMVSLERLGAKIDLLALFSGQIKVDSIGIDGLSVFLETDGRGRANWKFPVSSPSVLDKKDASATPTGGLPLRVVVRDVRLRDIRIFLRDGATGKTRKLFLANVRLTADRFNAPVFVAVDATYGNVPIKVRGKFGSLKLLTDAGDAAFPVRLKMTAPGVGVEINGDVKSPLTASPAVSVRVRAEVTDRKAFGKILGPGLSRLPRLFPLKGRVGVSGSGTRYVFTDLDLQAGKSTLAGNGNIDFSSARPRVSANLNSGVLDFDAFTGGRRRTAQTDGKARAGSRVFSAAPLPWALLKTADANIKINVRRIRAAGLSMTRARARVKLLAGRLDVKDVRFALAGGFVSASLRLNATTNVPSVQLRAKMTQVDVGRVLKMQGLGNILFLPVSAQIRLSGSGGSVRRVMANMNGSIQAVARGGRIDSKAFSGLTAGAVSIVPWAARKDAGTITCMIADWRVRAGIATARSVLMDTPGFRVAVRGNADLGAEKLHLNVLPQAKTLSLASFAVPVRLKGPFSAPYVDVSPAGLVVGTVKNVVNAPGNIVSDLLGVVGMGGDKNASCVQALSGGKTRPEGRGTKRTSTPQGRGFNPVKDLGNTLDKAFKGIFGP